MNQRVIDWRRAFNAVRYKPHDVQLQIHKARRQSRFRVVSAGRRTGKSTAGGHELFVRHLEAGARQAEYEPKGKRAEYWIVGPEYTDAEKEFRVLYNDLSQAGAPFDKPGTYYDPNGGDMHISMFGGRFLVSCQSAKYPQNLVGEALKGVVMAEAAKMRPTIWPKFIRPMLADYARDPVPSWALFNSTPEGKNWFYDIYMRGLSTAEEDAEWWGIRMPSWSNNHLFPLGRQDPEILEMERDMTSELFKQEVEADFSEYAGRVYKDFSEESHVGDYGYNPRWPLAVATDYGFTNPNVALFIQWDIWDNVWVVAEYYRTNRTSDEFATDVMEDPVLGPLVRNAKFLFGDPEDPGATETLSNKWKVQKMPHTGGLLKDRIDLIRRWLRPHPPELEDGHPDKKPRLMFNQKLTPNTLREMGAYRYPDTKAEANYGPSENPVKKDDHAPEALSRFFGGRYGQEFKAKARARQGRAVIRR